MITIKKRCELDVVLQLLRLDKTKKQIRETLNIKPSTLANRLRRLENLGAIERKGKFLIKVLRSSHLNPGVTKNQVHKKLNKRGHAFNFKVIFPNEKDLRIKDRVREEVKKKKLTRLPFGSLKLIKDKNTIWINKGSITIYSNNSYYSKDALHSKFRALKEIDNLVVYLKGRFELRGIYGIEVFREHYGLIFNKFAGWALERGIKLYVKDKGNKAILWVDDSRKDDINLKEFEGKDPLKINNADKYFNSHEKTGWKVTPEYNLKNQEETNNQINKLTGAIAETGLQLIEYKEQNKEHLALIQDYKAESVASKKVLMALLKRLDLNK